MLTEVFFKLHLQLSWEKKKTQHTNQSPKEHTHKYNFWVLQEGTFRSALQRIYNYQDTIFKMTQEYICLIS